ncbi:Fic/DOC family protein [Austwickia chelonae]|uniref:Fic/DOC family protein n=1 Tax=Austwickia chelonae TaxID=100225 RepID=UPI000E2644C8|nr:Fic family protein [Austwickia chelonae]
MKAIHYHLFQDVYEWAGQERTAPVGQWMVKDGHAYYPAGEPLQAAARQEYAKLADKGLLRGLEREDFVGELAESRGELNVARSFREGNTRSQFVFFAQLSEQAGYRLDTAVFAPGSPLREEFVQARFHGQDTGRNDQLATVLGKAITQVSQTGPRQDPGPQRGLAARAASFPKAGTRVTRPKEAPTAQRDTSYRSGQGYGLPERGQGRRR